MIRAIIFDLGNVIVPIDFSRCHTALSKVCPYPPQEVPHRIRSAGLVESFETGQISPPEFLRAVSRVLEMDVGEMQFWELWNSIFLPDTLIPDEMLAGLRYRQRLLLLSNTNAIHFAMVKERYLLLSRFDDCVLSYEVGAVKPSPVIYQEAVARSGYQPEECFYADDIPAYVEAARREGLDAVQFFSLEQLQKDLQARGISWE
ncbi:MAG: HAD family phosphatase [Acidobacteria bacterium]|nr:HAD family phosphatase [Acidobacteriota bacterium]